MDNTKFSAEQFVGHNNPVMADTCQRKKKIKKQNMKWVNEQRNEKKKKQEAAADEYVEHMSNYYLSPW